MKDFPPEFSDNESEHHFEWTTPAGTAFIDYKKTTRQLMLIHTEVPETMQGQGIAPKLVTAALTFAEENGLKVIPLCVYVLAFLKKHPEWNRVLAHEPKA